MTVVPQKTSKENDSRRREWKLVLNVADTASKIGTEKNVI